MTVKKAAAAATRQPDNPVRPLYVGGAVAHQKAVAAMDVSPVPPATTDQLSMSVLVRDPVDGKRCQLVQLSLFCPLCACRRGHPQRVVQSDGCAMDVWSNPCGHLDSPETLAVELETQCARPGCVLGYSDTYYPYCSTECAERRPRKWRRLS